MTLAVAKATPTFTLVPSTTAPTVNQLVTFSVPSFTTPASTAATQPTGTFNINHGATTLCSFTLPATSCTYTFTGVGGSSIVAAYQGDTQFNSASSASLSLTIGATGTSTAVTGPSTASVNANVTFTATVTPAATTTVSGAPVPTGSVKFTSTSASGTTTLCASAALSATGTATCSYAFTSASSYTVAAAYTATGANFTSSSSTSATDQTVTVSSANTGISVASSTSGSSVVNQPVTFTSTFTRPSGSGAPTGNVTFFDGTTQLCSPVAVSATNTCVLSTGLALGSHSITVKYAGDANFNSSTSTAVAQTVTAQSTTTTAATSTATPVVNQSFSLTATVAATYPVGTAPSASVAFTYTPSGSTTPSTLCTATVANKGSASSPNYQASCSPSSLAAGTYNIYATYNGTGSDKNFSVSTSTAAVTVTIGQDTPTTTLTVSSASPAVNQALTLNAKVAPSDSGTIAPSGTVVFAYGATTLCTATVTSGAASCTAPNLPVAGNPYNIIATYSGDNANFKTSASTATAVNIKPAATTVAIASSMNPSYASQQVVYAVTVTTSPAVPAGGIVPTGTISFTSHLRPGSVQRACARRNRAHQHLHRCLHGALPADLHRRHGHGHGNPCERHQLCLFAGIQLHAGSQ